MAGYARVGKDTPDYGWLYRSLIDDIQYGVSLCRIAYRHGRPVDFFILMTNRAYRGMTGLEDVDGKRFSEVLPELFLTEPQFMETYARVVETGKAESFERFVKTLQKWFMVSAYRSMPDHFFVVFEDITERKLAEQTLLESEASFHELADAMPQLVWVSGLDGNSSYLNSKCHEYLGLAKGDIAGKNAWLSRIHPDDLPGVMEKMRSMGEETMDAFSVEYRMKGPDGAYRWFLDRAQPARDACGKIVKWYGTATDVHDLKLVQEAARLSEARLRLAHQVASIGTFQWNIRTATVDVSSETEALFGVNGVCDRKTAFWMSLIHDDDRVRVGQRLRDALASGVFECEWRAVRPDGTLRWLSGRGQVFRGENGNPLRMLGITMDITGRKRAEDAARELAEQRQLALDAAHLGWWCCDPVNQLFSHDGRYAEIFGFEAGRQITVEEGQKRVHPDDFERVMAAFIAPTDQKSTRPHSVEYRIVLDDGSVRWVESGWKCTYGGERDARHPTLLTGTLADITERKRAEQREQRLLDLLRALSATNDAIIHSPSESVLLASACRIAVEHGRMALAWIGVPEPGGRFVCMANHGSTPSTYVENLIVSIDPRVPEGHGPDGVSYRDGKTVVVNDIGASDMIAAWKEELARLGLFSMASLPIRRMGGVYGVFILYSADTGAFDDEIVRLLEEMAGNIGFALGNLDRDAARRRAEEDLRLAAMVYRDSSEGMLVTDAGNRIITVNRAFTEITGYEPADVIGRTPAILKSGNHDEAFYQSMWQQIIMTGRFSGELWNRRKNGEFFAAHLIINLVVGERGSPHRYVALLSDITERKRSDELIWLEANFDNLTGLPNRRFFRDRLEYEVRNARRSNLPLALIFIDLDGFKDVNDTLGHDTGDQLLKEAADRLRNSVRDTDTVARLGGDEFAIILTGQHSPGNVDRVADHILKTLSEPIHLGEETAYVSASLGITLFPDDATGVEDLIKSADQAMYAAKEHGKNRYHFFTPAMQDLALKRMRLINDMRGALDAGQFEIVYQPIVEFSSGIIRKAEALIRWQHPRKGLVSPVDFISVAEDTGLITSFGNWIFREAAKQAAVWREKYHSAFQISINISPVQFRNEGVDPSVWLSHLRGLGLPGQGIVVEITEGLLLEANKKVTDQLLMLRDAGIEVSLDDFGTGYSSLSYLKKFDIDYIKIDQSFVRNLAEGSDDMALCEAIIVMAHKLNMRVIAEGVEKPQQQELLAMGGCDFAQGYLFSKPVPADEFERLLQSDPFSKQELLDI